MQGFDISSVLQNVMVRDDAEGTENDPDRNIDFNIRDCGLQDVSKLHQYQFSNKKSGHGSAYRTFLIPMEHFHLELTDRSTTNLSQKKSLLVKVVPLQTHKRDSSPCVLGQSTPSPIRW